MSYTSAINLSSLDGSTGFKLDGVSEDDRSGISVSSAGDVNGDGYSDFIIGANLSNSNGSNAGSSYVVFGKSGGFDASVNLSTLNGSTGFRLAGGTADDNSGYSVAAAGDVNGDGLDDMIIGARYADPNSQSLAGSAYVVFGKTSGFASSINLSTLNGTTGFRLDVLVVSSGATADATLFEAWTATSDSRNDGSAYLTVAGYTVNLAAVTNGTKGWLVSNDGNETAVTLTGSAKADTLIGGTGADSLIGGADDDSLDGGAGNDELTGGEGNDSFIISAGTDSVTDLGKRRDVLVVWSGATVNAALAADWTATEDSKNDGAANLTAVGYTVNLEDASGDNGWSVSNADNGSDVSLTGSAKADTLTGGNGADSLSGGDGDDSLDGGAGDDTLTGGAGADTFIIGAGTDSVTDLGTGSDVLVVSSGATVNATLAADWTATASSSNAGTANINAAGYSVDLSFASGNWSVTNAGSSTDDINASSSSDVSLTGSANNDTLTGGDGNDSLSGGAGDDSLDGGAGNDTLIGGDGADGLSGGDGEDSLDGGADNDTLTGAAGADFFTISAGTDSITDLGDGADVLAVSAGAGVNATLAGDWTATSSSSNAGTANLIAAGFAVNLAAASGANGWSVSNAGNATSVSLTGSSNADTLIGGDGAETLSGGAGNDSLNGGAGDDLALLAGNQSDYRFGVRDGVVITSGADGIDQFSNIERFKWGSAAEISLASLSASGSNVGLFYSEIGNGVFEYRLPDAYTGPFKGIVNQEITGDTEDIVYGTQQADFIYTGAGDDAVDGGGGNDVIDGGLDSNFLIGSAGVDTFFLDGRAAATTTTWSTITDLSPGEHLTIWGYQPGVSRLLWVANDGADGYKGATMHSDLDGNGVIDTSVTFSGLTQAQLPAPIYGFIDGNDYIMFG